MSAPTEPQWQVALREVACTARQFEELKCQLDLAQQARKRAVISAWLEMAPVRQIAQTANVTAVTVRQWAKAAGLPMRK